MKDPAERKYTLAVGAYRDDDGQPHILKSVREAEMRLLAQTLNHEYAPIIGVKKFVDLSLGFALGGDSPAIADNRVSAVQTLSGTGACRLANTFIKRFVTGSIYVPDPTWGNHIPIAKDSGLDVNTYRYLNRDTQGLDLEGFLADVNNAPNGSAFLIHACAHNPTGVDPRPEQWKEISAAMKAKGHLPFFDCAYQGFASGNADADAFAIRRFVEDGHQFMLAQSFAKNFGLYGQRVGCFSVVCKDTEESKRVLSQIKILVRPMYSSPPIHGARIVQTILEDAELEAQWRLDCKEMADRVIDMRYALRTRLEKGSSRNWQHVTDQIGMFCYSGLTKQEVMRVADEYHVYFTHDGRISMAGLTTKNIDYVAESIKAVIDQRTAERNHLEGFVDLQSGARLVAPQYNSRTNIG